MSRLIGNCDGRRSAAALLAAAENKPRAAASLLRLLDQRVLVPGPLLPNMEVLTA